MKQEEANIHEIKIHNKLNVGINHLFYNRAKHTSKGFDRTGSTNSEISKILQSERMKNNTFAKGCKHTAEQNKAKSDRMIGKPNPTKGIKRGPQKRITCPHCNLTSGASNMKRKHFDKCKDYSPII